MKMNVHYIENVENTFPNRNYLLCVFILVFNKKKRKLYILNIDIKLQMRLNPKNSAIISRRPQSEKKE